MAGRIMDPKHKVEKFLDREEVAHQMNAFVKTMMPDVEIDPANVVEVPSDGCKGHLNLGEWKTWAARCGEFLIVAIDGNGYEASISLY